MTEEIVQQVQKLFPGVVVQNLWGTVGQVKAFALQNGPAYQYPQEVYFLDEMLLNVSREIDKNQLLRLLDGMT